VGVGSGIGNQLIGYIVAQEFFQKHTIDLTLPLGEGWGGAFLPLPYLLPACTSL
jgi:hypothetical protein